MAPTLPAKLSSGSHVRVVAPSTSMAAVGIPWPWHDIAQQRLAERGLTMSFGARALERDSLDTAPVDVRVADLHDAFADPDVDGILTVLGGFHANQLLPALDMELIRRNPKVFCGYSDITVLHHALLTGANLVSYSGPHYTTFGMRDHLDQTAVWFDACLLSEDPVIIRPAERWSDDMWFNDQDARCLRPSDGWWVLREGVADGVVVGGNLCTLNLVQGTGWLPDLTGCLVVVEDDAASDRHTFIRDLQSLLHQPGGDAIAGLVIGRFQAASGIRLDDLQLMVDRFPQLAEVPVVANVDVGHTNPFFTFPVGGEATLHVDPEDPRLVLTRH